MKGERMAKQERVRIWKNDPVGPGYHCMGLRSDRIYETARAGQFVTLRFPDGIGPLLRRPFSIHRRSAAGIELLYRVVGGFTRRLAHCEPGEEIDLLGPLGNGFDVPPGIRRGFMVAGGIGVAPLRFLADEIRERGDDPAGWTVFIGGRTQHDLLCGKTLRGLGLTVVTATEDGSAGVFGRVTVPYEAAMARHPPEIVCACGPVPMLRAVAGTAAAAAVPCRVSVETVMACGLGACLGCAVVPAEETGGYRHVCRDGPVFDGGALKI